MSLLMDALRKAEQEKKEALKKRQEEEEAGQADAVSSVENDEQELALEPESSEGSAQVGDENGSQSTPLYADNDEIDWRGEDEDSSDLTLGPINEGYAASEETGHEAVSPEKKPLELEETPLESESQASGNLDEYDDAHAIGPAGERYAAASGEDTQDRQDSEATQQDGRTFSETLRTDADATHDETDMSVTAQTETEPEISDATTRARTDVFAAHTVAFSSRDPTINERIEIPRDDSRFTREQTSEITGTNTSGSLNQYSTSAAHNVFAASKHSSSAAWTIAALFSLVLVALVAYGIFYYYSVTPLDRNVPSPTVARGVETDIQETPVLTESIRPIDKSVANIDATPVLDEIAAEIETEAALSADSPAAESTDGTESAETAPTTAQTESAQADEVTEATSESGSAETAGTESPEVAAIEPRSDSGQSEAESAGMQPAARMEADEPLELKPALVKISRSRVPDRESRAVMDAYQAYSTGQYSVARDLYRTALNNDPENRDALLGLAAIAVREGNYQAAYSHYLKLLELNPADPVAKSALISLQGRADPVTSRSQLMLLLEDYPNAAYLHHALGSVYAGQRNWPEAQQAYFEAYRNDNSNPNYALNLAVSLDHMGQKSTALKYYQDAIRLARSHPAAFDPMVVNVRVEELKTAVQ